MKPRILQLGLFLIAMVQGTISAHAHDGRGFEIEVVAGKLQAQGVNNGADDGAPAVRLYVNSIHDHWSNYISQLDQSSTTFPEFEVTPQVASSFLAGYSLELELIDSWQWVAPSIMPAAGTIPNLESLDPGEVISIQTLAAPITTDSLGTIQLSTSVPSGGTGDIVPSYTIVGQPLNEIHVLQLRLSATAPDPETSQYESSDPLFVILSPDGTGPVERLHHASLYLEEYLALNGIPVPEPGAGLMLVFGTLSCLFLRISHRSPHPLGS